MTIRQTARATAVRCAVVVLLLLLPASAALASWTATGKMLYQDREYDQTGFTGNQPQIPIRYADVEIVDAGNKSVLAKGATNASGDFSVYVVDSKTRNVYARVVTRSTATSNLFVDVQQNDSRTILYYSVATNTISKHSPNANVNWGTWCAAIGQGGEAFNIFDQLVRGADYIASLTGSRPPSSKDLSAIWKINRGVTGSYYEPSYRRIQCRDTQGYDDSPILHEMGHYFQYEYSASDAAGGYHTFTECNEDLPGAFDEGFATYWGNSALRYAALPRCNIYARTTGAPGPGGLVRYADLETDTQYLCQGDTSEVNIFTILWDINDSASTTDTTPGVEDSHDTLSLPDTEVSQVMRDALPSATSVSFEDFWDGWFAAPISNGNLQPMLAISQYVSVDFTEDAAEVNNSAATAAAIGVDGVPVPATFFYDSNGDGAGQADADYYFFAAAAATTYRAETLNLISDGNTFLEILDTDGATVLASNDDRASGDETSLLDWTAPAAGTYYVRVTDAADAGIYGGYQVKITQM